MTASGNGMNSRFPVVNNLYSIHFRPSHTITTTQCKEHEHKWSICISGCKFHPMRNSRWT